MASRRRPRCAAASLALLQDPPGRARVLWRAHDPLLDGELGAPAERADARAIEEDERAIAHPAALSAGVAQLRREAERARDPADGIVHLAVFICAQIEHIHGRGAALRG